MQADNGKLTLQNDIRRLEAELAEARARLSAIKPTDVELSVDVSSGPSRDAAAFNSSSSPSHHLLLLADSALPLGSFAFSSGLESYLAHHSPAHNAQPSTLPTFMHMSILSLASTTLPYLIAAYRSPDRICELDDELDACLLCPVARRASISQGKALITIWERSLRAEAAQSPAKEALWVFCARLKASRDVSSEDEVEINAHFPLVYALVCAAQGLSLHEAAFTYLFNHAKTVASAAVRAGLLGPYAAQALLASKWLEGEIEGALVKEWAKDVREAGQPVPALDVWIGRHELLYSRIFNS